MAKIDAIFIQNYCINGVNIQMYVYSYENLYTYPTPIFSKTYIFMGHYDLMNDFCENRCHRHCAIYETVIERIPISKFPLGTVTVTTSPTFFPSSAFAMGVSVEIFFWRKSASLDDTMIYVSSFPVVWFITRTVQ